MKFSVITVCLNSADTIEKTIESVLSQQGVEIEYIIIDGGSTDNTVEIIKKYESRIAYWCSESDGGIYEAMNKGISVATGDMVSFINSSDWYADGALACIQQKMKEGEFDLVCGKVARVKNGVVFRIDSKPEDETEIYYKMYYQHQGIFARRSIFSEFGNFDLQYRICADYDWLLRVYNKGVSIAYVDVLVSYFSIGGVSAGIDLLPEKKAICLKHLPQILHDKYYDKIIEMYENDILPYKYHYALEYLQHDRYLAKKIKEALSISNICSLFCTGKMAGECCELLERLDIAVKHIYDNDQKKQGKEFLGRVIESPARIRPDETIVIGTTLYADEIKEQLEKYEILKVIKFRDIMRIVVSHIEEIRGRAIDLEELKNV